MSRRGISTAGFLLFQGNLLGFGGGVGDFDFSYSIKLEIFNLSRSS
jgi:hypothetical protein